MAMPMMRWACLVACSRASSSMRLTMWAASIRASSSITRTSSSLRLLGGEAGDLLELAALLGEQPLELRLALLDALLAAGERAVELRRAPCRAGSRSSVRLSRLSSFWVEAALLRLELGALACARPSRTRCAPGGASPWPRSRPRASGPPPRARRPRASSAACARAGARMRLALCAAAAAKTRTRTERPPRRRPHQR